MTVRTFIPGGGGTDLGRGYRDVLPWRPPFHASPATRKGPISSKRVSSQDPLLRKFGNFSLYSLNFHPNFSSQAPKFGNFQLTSPPPFQRQVSFRKPHISEIRAAHPYLKKSWIPPPGIYRATCANISSKKYGQLIQNQQIWLCQMCKPKPCGMCDQLVTKYQKGMECDNCRNCWNIAWPIRGVWMRVFTDNILGYNLIPHGMLNFRC